MSGRIYFLLAALVQNFVLTTGFGSSVVLRTSRNPALLLRFGVLQTVFASVAAFSAYPIDGRLGISQGAKMVRPLVMIGVVSVLYLLVYLLLSLRKSRVSDSMKKMLPSAAFNNVTVGVLLIANHQFALSLAGTFGFAAGASVGMLLLCLLMGALRRQVDHTAVPVPFRGLPLLLISFGLIALALCGFSPVVGFI